MKPLYHAWIRLDNTLPWIELEGTHRTSSEARRFAKLAMRKAKIKIVSIPEKKQDAKALATVKTAR